MASLMAVSFTELICVCLVKESVRPYVLGDVSLGAVLTLIEVLSLFVLVSTRVLKIGVLRLHLSHVVEPLRFGKTSLPMDRLFLAMRRGSAPSPTFC